MSKYKIGILKNKNDDEFKQLCDLMKKFAIHVFIVQKFDLMNECKNNREEYLKNYDKYLSERELLYIKKDVENRISFLKNSISANDGTKTTRNYLLYDDDRVIGFQTAQVRINNETKNLEGWRNFAYIDRNYMGKSETVVNYSSIEKKGIMSDIVYDDITEWFREKHVVLEKTATGRNMYKNILAYIVYKGFEIDYCDNERIYLKKDITNIKEKKERIKIYKKYKENN